MTQKYYIYILKSNKDNKYYTGFTRDLNRRFKEHCQGIVKSTRNRRPLELIHFESFDTKKEAELREKFLKTGVGRAELKKLLN